MILIVDGTLFSALKKAGEATLMLFAITDLNESALDGACLADQALSARMVAILVSQELF